jgi:hypothetical protein
MRVGSMRNAVMALALLAPANLADARGIAGNRFFVGTLTFDDPPVAEKSHPLLSALARRCATQLPASSVILFPWFLAAVLAHTTVTGQVTLAGASVAL